MPFVAMSVSCCIRRGRQHEGRSRIDPSPHSAKPSMTLLRGLALLLATLFIAACGGGGGGSSGSGTLSVKMTDAPAAPEYAEVWVTVEKVRVHQNDSAGDGDSGWQEIVLDPPRKIELLDLRNGVLAELGQVEVPAGTYHQFRLVLGDGRTDNEVVLASAPSTRIPLTT